MEATTEYPRLSYAPLQISLVTRCEDSVLEVSRLVRWYYNG